MVLPDWAMLDGCFGATKVKASDIDGYIHQNGSVLFLEKKFPNGWLDEPQIRAINTLVKQGNSFIVIWCERSDGSDISLMRVFGVDGFDWQNRQAANLQDFRSAVQQWWQRAYKPGSV
jgi:hypothetical protein